MVQGVPEEEIEQQRTSFQALLESLGEASEAEIERALAEREVVEPETNLESVAVKRLKERIAERRLAA